MLSLLVLVAGAACAFGHTSEPHANTAPKVTVNNDGNSITVANGYTQFITTQAAMTSLKADFSGTATYGEELLAGSGVALELAYMNGTVIGSNEKASHVKSTVHAAADGSYASVTISFMLAGTTTTAVWQCHLDQGSPAISFNTTGTSIAAAAGGLVRLGLYATPLSVYGFYPDDGVVQMMNPTSADVGYMPSNRSVGRVYMIGGINPQNTAPRPTDGTQGSIDIVPLEPVPVSALMSASRSTLAVNSGYFEVVSGAELMDSSKFDSWTNPFSESPCYFRQTGKCNGLGPREPSGDKQCNVSIPCDEHNCPSGYCECKDGQKKHFVSCVPGTHKSFTCAEFCSTTNERSESPKVSWATGWKITPNNHNYPLSDFNVQQANLPEADLSAIMAGIYGSAPGCLCTFPNSPSCPGLEGLHLKNGEIATTIARPDRGYGGTYNYFDPDNFFSMTALIYSGNPFLQEQARTVIEFSGSHLCIGEVQNTTKCTYGQLPHHFNGPTPTFLALSGATQTGPNTFWVKSALQYARNSGNINWLKSYMPTLRAAAAFCFDLINKENHLLLAPGSLMIDVFIRANYTADSNAMMVGFLNEFADAEDAVGNVTGATALRAEATAMANAVNQYLWDGTDHYVTQVDPDDMDCATKKSCRDFVDYDSNLIAVAHGIATGDKAQAVLKRIDTGIQKCTAAQGGGPQWVSEIYYGKHDTTSGNIGDSATAMGRIAWFDAKARKFVGDVDGFDKQLAIMQGDLLRYTWMHERYACDGHMMTNRTAAYFEYPSTVAIILREIRYGIELSFKHVQVAPMPNKPYHYHIGDVNIDYNPNGTTYVQVPPSGARGNDREFRIHGMDDKATYHVVASADCDEARLMPSTSEMSADVQPSKDGLLKFQTHGHCGVTVVRN